MARAVHTGRVADLTRAMDDNPFDLAGGAEGEVDARAPLDEVALV